MQDGVVADEGCIQDYLSAIVAHDWGKVRAYVTEDVVRIGPYGDTFRGRETYVSYLERLMPKLEGYAMEVRRITYADDGRSAFAELTERVTVNGTPTVTEEVLVFAVDSTSLIERVEIYIRQSGTAPPRPSKES